MTPSPSDSPEAEVPRRPRGCGTLYPHRGGYRAEFPLGGGAREKKDFSTKDSALDWLDRHVIRRYGGASWQARETVRDTNPTSDMTMLDYATNLIEKRYADGDIGDGTLRNYRSALGKYWGDIGRLTLRSVASENIREFKDSLNVMRPGVTSLRYDSQHGQWRFLMTVLNAAARDGLIDSRVATSVTFPTKQAWERTLTQRKNPQAVRPRRRTGSDANLIPYDTFKRISSKFGKGQASPCSFENHALSWCGPEAYLALVTGLRQGERLAIRRNNFQPRFDAHGGVVTATLALDHHAIDSAWFHGCGDPSSSGDYPCGKDDVKACPQVMSDRQGATARKLVRGTKSKDESSTHYIHLPTIPANLIAMHMEFMRVHEGLDREEHLLFGGNVLPSKPMWRKKDTKESYELRLREWRAACARTRRDGITIRTSDRDREAWDAVQESNFFAAESKGFTVHAIRHSLLAHLARYTNLNAIQIMDLANHSSLRTTMSYISTYRPEGASAAVEAATGFGVEYAASLGVDLQTQVVARSEAMLS